MDRQSRCPLVAVRPAPSADARLPFEAAPPHHRGDDVNRLAAACATLAGVNGAIAVAAAAYGRHALGDSYAREVVAIGASYQLGHALALMGLASLAALLNAGFASPIALAACAFTLGTIFFSGTLYAVGMLGFLPVQGAAPIGGLFLIGGWLAVAFLGVRQLQKGECAGRS